MDDEQTDNSTDDSLDGVTGLGAARKALLHAAGVNTRAELAGMDPERLMRVARMPRHQAERTLASLRPAPTDTAAAAPPEAASAASGSPPAPIPLPSSDPSIVPPLTSSSPDGDLPAIAGRLRSLLGEPAQTRAPRVAKPLTRLAELLEGELAALSPKKKKTIADGLRALADRLDRALLSPKAIPPKREKRLRERLREERRKLAAVLGIKPRRRKPKKNAA
jgi:hypothetical protein